MTLNPLHKVKFQWAEKGSYRIKQLLEYINRLQARPDAFYPEKRVNFTLHNYSMHPSEIETALCKKGYFFIHIGGGITGDVQANHTTYHKLSKTVHQKK